MTDYARCPDCGKFVEFHASDGRVTQQPHDCNPENKERNSQIPKYKRSRPVIDLDPQPEIHPGHLLGDWTDSVQSYWRDREVET